MLSLYGRHAFQLSFAPLPGAFEPGPGIVFPQPRPLHSEHALQLGAMFFHVCSSTSLYVILLSPFFLCRRYTTAIAKKKQKHTDIGNRCRYAFRGSLPTYAPDGV
jgi:hypothetical protein